MKQPKVDRWREAIGSDGRISVGGWGRGAGVSQSWWVCTLGTVVLVTFRQHVTEGFWVGNSRRHMVIRNGDKGRFSAQKCVEDALFCMIHVADERQAESRQRQILGTDTSRECVVLHDTRGRREIAEWRCSLLDLVHRRCLRPSGAVVLLFGW